jgi:UDP-4-amino-4,6-dideoxy-N-acetyl-beta-L-altrosamine transaminase
VSFLPYGRQSISDEDVAAVIAALREPFITQGPLVDAFERAVAASVGARHAIAFSHGTAALHGAAAAAGIGPGDMLLTTPISFVASSNCALFCGGRPRFTDIDAGTWNIDVEAAARDAEDVKAIVAVSLAGLPVDLEPLQAARQRGVVVIEDAAQALGAHRGGRPVGGAGDADMHIFSLHPVKTITTGEGGIVTTERDDLAAALRRFRTHGIDRDHAAEDALPGGWHYDVVELAPNYRITDFQCALGLSQLDRVDEFVERRNRIASWYRERLTDVEGLTLPPAASPDARHAYHLFVVRFDEGAARRRQVYDALRVAEIGTQLHYIPIYRHALYRSLGYGGLVYAMPQAEAYYREALSLPIFPGMAEADVDRVTTELQRALTTALEPAVR